METKARRSVVAGRVSQVEFCRCGGGLTLTVGAVSVRFDMETAEDVAATLGYALSVASSRDAAWPLDASDDDGTRPS